MTTPNGPHADLVDSMAVTPDLSIGNAKLPGYLADEVLLTPLDSAGGFAGVASQEPVMRQAEAILQPPVSLTGGDVVHSGPRGLQSIRVQPERATTRNGRDFVRWATDAFNTTMLRQRSLQDGPPADPPFHLHAMPNWLVSSAQGWIHGPGTEPDPVPDGETTGGYDWPIEVPNAARWNEKKPEKQVVVCVLDSVPSNPSAALAAAIEKYPKNPRLRALNEAIVWSDVPDGRALPRLHTFAQPDHGLFVAGIINSIAPHARIHLLPVLDASGCGHTGGILTALAHCADLARTGEVRVVVNMSLYLLIPPDDVPPGLRLDDYWFSGDGFTPPTLAERKQLLSHLTGTLTRAMDELLKAGAVVVAAAGNDGLGAMHDLRATDPVHLQPRLPADYDRILCVVATDRSGRIANYSNQADLPDRALAPTNSIATWGGQGVRATEPNEPGYPDEVEVPPPTADALPDGIVGVCTAQEVERGSLGAKSNDTGWIRWSGTSFATPIISGIAANLLAQEPNLTTDEVRQRIQNAPISRPPEQGQDLWCRYVPVTQSRVPVTQTQR